MEKHTEARDRWNDDVNQAQDVSGGSEDAICKTPGRSDKALSDGLRQEAACVWQMVGGLLV